MSLPPSMTGCDRRVLVWASGTQSQMLRAPECKGHVVPEDSTSPLLSSYVSAPIPTHGYSERTLNLREDDWPFSSHLFSAL